MVELEEGGGGGAAFGRPSPLPASCTEEEVSSILAMSTRPAPCGSPAATIASAMRGSSASPGILTGCKAMEEFFGLGMEGPEDDGGEGNLAPCAEIDKNIVPVTGARQIYEQ